MLRISIDESEEAVLLRLEGQLIGPWVQDVEQCWRKTFLDPAFCGERERDSGALGADPRRDGADDWRLPGDGDTFVKRPQEETTDPSRRINPGHSKSYCVRSIGLLICPQRNVGSPIADASPEAKRKAARWGRLSC
jgi:hypothetical protein